MSELVLDVRLDGIDYPVGFLARDVYGELAFRYSDGYLDDPSAVRLSLSMPLTDSTFTDRACRAFFGNLLQERAETVQNVMRREGIEFGDIAGLLFYLGYDCPGAVSVLPGGAPPAKIPGNLVTDYDILAEDHFEAVVRALHRREPLPQKTADPSPIAGVQSKITLTRLPSGQFAQPKRGSGAPTTHILKVSGQDRPNETTLEAQTLLLSHELGIPTAQAVEIQAAGVHALLLERYDRTLDKNGHVIRLHQEDFAQALGLPASMKYQRNGRDNLRFDARALAHLIDQTADPVSSRQFIIQATLFDLLVGNNDGHAKNFSLLHLPNDQVSVAPRYDLSPVRLFDSFTDELAYHLGHASTFEAVTATAFDAFLDVIGIHSRSARKRLRQQNTEAIGSFLAGRLKYLDSVGLKMFADMIASNIRTLNDAFELPVPAQVKDRDAFLGRAGGWLMS